MIRLHATISPGEMRVAAWDGVRLHEAALFRRGAPDGVGDLYRGRVLARVRAMAGCFVALPGGVEGFLPDSEGVATEGSLLAVRITRAAQGGKGPRLSATLSDADRALCGDGPPALLRRGPDALARLAAAYPDAPILIDDAASAASAPRKAELVARAFPEELEEAWEALASPEAALPGGGVMHIFPTPALVAIDVDLGSATAARAGKAHMQSAANRALIPELCHQIRLRNLSGAILVDLGGMAQKKRLSLAPEFDRALGADPLRPRLLGFTQLGLAEIVRARVHPPLHELLATAHAKGLAALRQLAREAEAAPHRSLRLLAAADIADALTGDSVALAELQDRTGRKLALTTQRDWPSGRWRIEENAHG